MLAAFLLCQQLWLQATETEVFSPYLPDAFDGFRIVQLSDLHGRQFGQDNSLLLRCVEQLEPDIIAVTGDLLDEDAELPQSLYLLSALSHIAPTFFVTGNHEWSLTNTQDALDAMEAAGVTVLGNESVFLTKNGQQILLAGVHDPCGPRDMDTPSELGQRLRQQVGDDVFFLLLGHRNETAAYWAETTADLVLAGHAHGGLMRLPGRGGIIRRHGQLGFDGGLYASGRTQLFVSRGLGGQGLRLFNRPEAALLVLRKS